MKVERDVAAPPEAVWEVIIDIERSRDILSGITALERVDGGSDFGVGTRWRETRKVFGKQQTEEMEVTGIEPGTSYTVESDGNGAHYTSLMAVQPKGDGAVLSLQFEGEPTNTVAKIASVFGKLFEGSMRKMLQTDLDEIAAAAVADAAKADAAKADAATAAQSSPE